MYHWGGEAPGRKLTCEQPPNRGEGGNHVVSGQKRNGQKVQPVQRPWGGNTPGVFKDKKEASIRRRNGGGSTGRDVVGAWSGCRNRRSISCAAKSCSVAGALSAGPGAERLGPANHDCGLFPTLEARAGGAGRTTGTGGHAGPVTAHPLC